MMAPPRNWADCFECFRCRTIQPSVRPRPTDVRPPQPFHACRPAIACLRFSAHQLDPAEKVDATESNCFQFSERQDEELMIFLN